MLVSSARTSRPSNVTAQVDSIRNRIRSPFRRFVAGRLFDAAARNLGADPRDTEPGKVIGMVEPVPLLLIHGSADSTVPLAEGERLMAGAGPSTEHWVVEGADHSRAHAVAGQDYERRVSDFLRMAFRQARDDDLGTGEGGL